MPTKLSLAISPCPNDTYIFGAIIKGYITIPNVELDIHYLDIAALNDKALDEQFDLSKISYYCYTKLTESYYLLDSGGALGHNCGPLLISKRNALPENPASTTAAIPGQNTTANMLLSLAIPEIKHKREFLFSDIEQAVVEEQCDTGLIIHENRFTYQEKGLEKILDLGEWWEETTQCPIPLGGILAHKRLDKNIIAEIEQAIVASIQYADEHTEKLMPFILEHAQEMQKQIVMQHIALYVNEYSKSLGKQGKMAVDTLFGQLKAKKLLDEQIFPNYFREPTI